VTDEFLSRLRNNPYQFIVVNFANGDMVGHTGDMAAATKAIGIVDQCVGKIVDRLLELDAHILITADHGNSEQMIDYQTGMTKTSHTLNPVELIYVAGDSRGKQLLDRGKLSDIAPTVLSLLGLDIPGEMTAQNLIV
jgi:2,3-bisphosphoglycerate-independent phosphoglycerate mutase